MTSHFKVMCAEWCANLWRCKVLSRKLISTQNPVDADATVAALSGGDNSSSALLLNSSMMNERNFSSSFNLSNSSQFESPDGLLNSKRKNQILGLGIYYFNQVGDFAFY